MNATIARFGHPATLVADYEHWVVLLRPEQPTLGALVLAAKGDATRFGALPSAAFAEFGMVVADIEVVLARAVDYARINYLMLMMVDPHVHFHVVPRYGGTRRQDGVEVADAGWPKAPALGEAIALSSNQIDLLTGWLRAQWPG